MLKFIFFNKKMENIDNFFQKYTFSKTKSPQNTDESFSPFKLKKLIKNSHFVPQEFNKIYEQIKQYRLLHN